MPQMPLQEEEGQEEVGIGQPATGGVLVQGQINGVCKVRENAQLHRQGRTVDSTG